MVLNYLMKKLNISFTHKDQNNTQDNNYKSVTVASNRCNLVKVQQMYTTNKPGKHLFTKGETNLNRNIFSTQKCDEMDHQDERRRVSHSLLLKSHTLLCILSFFITFCLMTPTTWAQPQGNGNHHASISPMSSTKFANSEIEMTDYVDYIIVGGGSFGSSLTASLSKKLGEDGSSRKVLLLERGKARSYIQTPTAMDIYGAGLAINDPAVSQTIISTQGVRTHLGNVMGGGSSINLAILIDETEEYINYLGGLSNGIELPVNYEDNKRVTSMMPRKMLHGDAWAKALEEAGSFDATSSTSVYNHENLVSTEDPNHSNGLEENTRWSGMSLFSANEGYYRRAADVKLKDVTYEHLTIKTEHTVEYIEFDMSNPNIPRAQCVVYRNTHPIDDGNEIGNNSPKMFGIPVPNWNSVFGSVWGAVNTVKTAFGYQPANHRHVGIGKLIRACIPNDSGRIILSAGAVMSTILLYKSGVGPRDQVHELKLPLIKNIPQLGQQLSDRVLIPVAGFLKKDLPHETYEPRVCQQLGFAKVGSDCSSFNMGSKSLKCSFISAEELSGGRIPEGVIYSTRFLFPPKWRNDAAIDYALRVLEDCSENRIPLNNVLLKPICKLANPMIDCFRRVFSLFYFTAEPKSRGKVSMDKNGQIEFEANYLQHPQDLFDAVRGVSNLIDMMNTDAFKEVAEPISPNSCPATILNGFLDIILQLGASSTSKSPDLQSNFHKIRKNISDLIPQDSVRRRRLAINNKVIELNEDHIEYIAAQNGAVGQEVFRGRKLSVTTQATGTDATMEPTGTDATADDSDSDSNSIYDKLDVDVLMHAFKENTREIEKATRTDTQTNDDESSILASRRRLQAAGGIKPGCELPCKMNENGQMKCDSRPDIFNYVANKCALDALDNLGGFSAIDQIPELKKLAQDATAITNDVTEDEIIEGTGWLYNKLKSDWISPGSKKQWAATYPPTLPDTQHPEDVAQYVLSYMTSIWHHAGTAPLGTVVDKDYKVNGIDQLYIADASIINQVPRMNPVAHFMALGDAAGRAMADIW